MKKLNIFCSLALVGLLATSLTSCKEEAEDMVTLNGPQVYFNNAEKGTINLVEDATSFDITLHRSKTDGALTVPITFTPDEGNIYTVPSEVTFENGADKALITVTYDQADVVLGNYVGGTIAFDRDALGTPYGENSYTFVAGVSPWVDVLDENEEPVFAVYREDLVTGIFNVENVVYRVPLQVDATDPGMYRLVNPYGEWYESKYGGYNTPNDYDKSEDYYMVINAKDPDYVWVTECNTGTDYGYGNMMFTSLVQLWLDNGNTLDYIKENAPGAFGTLKNNVITMPTESMVWAMAGYYNGEWMDYTNKNGKFAIALPGGVLKEYGASYEYKGRFNTPDNDDYARFVFTLEKDVTNASYALVNRDDLPLDGEQSVDVDLYEQQLQDGTIETHKIAGEETEEDVYFYYSGVYILSFLLYDNGELVGIEHYRVNLTNSADATIKERYEDVGYGFYTIGVEDFSEIIDEDGKSLGFFNPTGEGEYPQEVPVTFSRGINDPTNFKIEPWWHEPLYFNYDEETGKVTVDTSTGWRADDVYIQATDVETYMDMDLTDFGLHSCKDGDVFKFYLVYHTPDQLWAAQLETFELMEDEGDVKAQMKSYRAARSFAQRLAKAQDGKVHKIRKIKKNGRNLRTDIMKRSMSELLKVIVPWSMLDR